MGQAKYNKTAILAKTGKLSPKKKSRKRTPVEFLNALSKTELLQYQRDIFSKACDQDYLMIKQPKHM